MRFRIVLIGLLAVVTSGCSRAEQQEEIDWMHGLPEQDAFSVVIPADQADRFLECVGELLDEWLKPDQIRQFREAVTQTAVGDVEPFEYSVTFHGRNAVLEVEVFLDSRQCAEIYLFSSPPLIKAIREMAADNKIVRNAQNSG